MKTLTLLRHAKSDWSDTVLRDFDRPLNPRGQRAARIMGQWAKREGLAFDAIVASPAIRVVETLDHFLDGYGDAPDIRWDRRIYLASVPILRDVLRDCPADLRHILLVGHNPGFEDLVLDLVPDDGASPLRNEVEIKYPTATLASIMLRDDQWDSKAGGDLIRFVRPRDLDPTLGPDAR